MTKEQIRNDFKKMRLDRLSYLGIRISPENMAFLEEDLDWWLSKMDEYADGKLEEAIERLHAKANSVDIYFPYSLSPGRVRRSAMYDCAETVRSLMSSKE